MTKKLEKWVKEYVGGKNKDYDYMMSLPYLHSIWSYQQGKIDSLENELKKEKEDSAIQ